MEFVFEFLIMLKLNELAYFKDTRVLHGESVYINKAKWKRY